MSGKYTPKVGDRVREVIFEPLVPSTPEDRFAANLRTLREHRGLSQEALAAAMAGRGYRWHQATVYKVESGERRIQLGEATAVAAVLGVPLDKMIEPTEDVVAVSEIRKTWNEFVTSGERLEKVLEAHDAIRRELERLFTTAAQSGAGALDLLSPEERRRMEKAVTSVERLPDPEPDWQTRDVVVDADGVCYLRDGLGAWRNFAGVAYATDFPTRPLTLLVRDGKPVLS